MKLAKLSISKSAQFGEEQIEVWMEYLLRDLKKGEITLDGVEHAIEKLSTIETYAKMDYSDLYEIAALKKGEKDFKDKYVVDGCLKVVEGDEVVYRKVGTGEEVKREKVS